MIKKNINTLENTDDFSLECLNCGFFNDKLADYISAIDKFSKSISYRLILTILDASKPADRE